MCAVFAAGEGQKKAALESRDQEAARRGRKIATEILPLGEFYLAEDYHQKYYLRQNKELAQEYLTIYPAVKDFIRSTAVMRVNAYLDGEGTLAGLEKEMDSLGLSPAGRERLLALFKRSKSIR